MKEQLEKITEKLHRARILILGDFLLDEFVFGEISRVSREAPVLILKYQETDSRPGGAANTAANVAALGAEVIPVGQIGADEAAERLTSLWPERVNRDFLFQDPGHRTTRKSRFLAGSFHSYRQQVVRLDYEHPLALTGEQETRLIEALGEGASGADALLISDYSLGCVTPRLRDEMLRLSRERSLPLVVDSRDHPGAYPGVTSVTPNITEVESAREILIGTSTERLDEVGFETRRLWEVEALLVTRGKLGISLFLSDGALHLPCYGASEAVDVTGAGDTVAAIYTAALAVGAGFRQAATLANYAGGLVVMKRGTATVSQEELGRAVRDGHPIPSGSAERTSG